jgi:hypothetical protein
MGKALKTEHSGAKKGRGYWGRKKQAKTTSKGKRRANDKKAIAEEGTYGKVSSMDFEFPVVNRSLMLIIFRQPYVDWANQLPDRSESEHDEPHTIESINQEPTACLVPEIFDDDELEAFLERMWVPLFEKELASWCTDEKLWPKKRSFKMFTEWFEISFSSMVFDLWSKEPLDHTDE